MKKITCPLDRSQPCNDSCAWYQQQQPDNSFLENLPIYKHPIACGLLDRLDNLTRILGVLTEAQVCGQVYD